MVLTVLPAHNEEKIIRNAIQSLKRQTHSTDILVVADNCADNTVKIAHECNTIAYETVHNRHKKAGALNQVFDKLNLDKYDYILIADADTVIHHNAIKYAVEFLEQNKSHAAVCSRAGVLRHKNTGLLWHLQNIEYGISDSSFVENSKNVHVCRGMFSMYRKTAIMDVVSERGTFYDLSSITEDYELTLTLKKLGYKISTCVKVLAYTDAPNDFKSLWIQRVRWTVGGFLDLKKHGLKKYTVGTFIGLFLYGVLSLMQVVFVTMAIVNSYFVFNECTIAIICLYYADMLLRFKYVSHKSLKSYLLVLSILPILLYGCIDTVMKVYCLALAVFNKKQKWGC